MFHSDCGWPTCQVVSLGGTGEGAALLLSRLVAGQRGLWTHESRGTFHQLWGKAKHTESRSAEKADDRHICNLIFTFKKLFKLTERTTVFYFVGHKRAVSPHTDTVFPVPVQFVPWWTGTLIAPQRVDASIFTASTIYAAFVNIYE